MLLLLSACTPPAPLPERERIARAVPALPREALDDALDAWECARSRLDRNTLAIIDFSRSSLEKRLWAIDLDTLEVVRMHVAHGRGSGGVWATAFSNEPESNQTSLGLFRGGEAYVGEHGTSLRLDGLDAGVNDRARDRAIVIHGADYATLGFLLRNGRLGRSLGCPAVPPDLAPRLVALLEDGGALFAWHPSADTPTCR